MLKKMFKSKWSILIKWSLIIFLFWIASWFIVRILFGPASGAGTFGDQFGAVNALFSGLALAGVIYTLIQQQEEMSTQRKEFREEMNLQRREFMNNRAINIAYRQVEKVEREIERIYWYKVYESKTHKSGFTDIETNGIYTLNRWMSGLRGADYKSQSQFILGNQVNLRKFFGVLSNSSYILLNVQAHEKMENIDAGVLFEIFGCNLDHRIWDFIQFMENLDISNLSKEAQDVLGDDLDKVLHFRDDWYRLANKV